MNSNAWKQEDALTTVNKSLINPNYVVFSLPVQYQHTEEIRTLRLDG